MYGRLRKLDWIEIATKADYLALANREYDGEWSPFPVNRTTVAFHVSDMDIMEREYRVTGWGRTPSGNIVWFARIGVDNDVARDWDWEAQYAELQDFENF